VTNAEVLGLRIKRFMAIGKEIADLTKESKKLRKEIAGLTEELGFTVTSEEPVEFLVGNTHVSVKRAKMENDFTIIPRELKQTVH